MRLDDREVKLRIVEIPMNCLDKLDIVIESQENIVFVFVFDFTRRESLEEMILTIKHLRKSLVHEYRIIIIGNKYTHKESVIS